MNKQVLLTTLMIVVSILMLSITVNAAKKKDKSPPLDLDDSSYEMYKNETKKLIPQPARLSETEREKYIEKVITQGPIRSEKAIPSNEFLDIEKEDKKRSFPDSKYINEQGIPIGDGNVESNIFDGLDNDNDGVIDEGYAKNRVQIAVQDAGKSKDDEFELLIDGISLGKNIGGRTRFWNIHIPEGVHEIGLKALNTTDGVGTYRIWFNRCNLKSGLPLQGIIKEGSIIKWTVQSGPNHPTHSAKQ